MNIITHDDLINAGFAVDNSDPIFPYNKSLMPVDYDPEKNDGYELSVVAGNAGFAISICDGSFIYFSAESADDAINWSKKIMSFEPPY